MSNTYYYDDYDRIVYYVEEDDYLDEEYER